MYIYCITNKKTKQQYVGKTNNPRRRKNEHKSCAFNKESHGYDKKLYQNIRQYNWNNFEFKIIEECDEENAEEREIYWIKKLQAELNEKFMFQEKTEEEIQAIKKDIINGVSYKQISKKYNVSIGYISMINNGHYHYELGVEYPLVLKGCVDKSWMKELFIALCNKDKSFREMTEDFPHCEAKIKNFNYGKQNKLAWAKYPIHKNKEYNLEQAKHHFPD